jgi:hypothetical protein
MLIYVKKKVFHRTDRRTYGRSTQNCSSEPNKKKSDLTLTEINVICDVAFYFINIIIIDKII